MKDRTEAPAGLPAAGKKWEMQTHLGNPRMARVKGLALRPAPEHEGGGWYTDPESAALIAAAPSLLSAAKHILSILDHETKSVTILDADLLRDAILLAESQPPKEA